MQTGKKLTRHSESRVTTHCSLSTKALVPALQASSSTWHRLSSARGRDVQANTAPSGDRSSGSHCLLWLALCTGALLLFIFWELPFPFFSVIKSKAKIFFFFSKRIPLDRFAWRIWQNQFQAEEPKKAEHVYFRYYAKRFVLAPNFGCAPSWDV